MRSSRIQVANGRAIDPLNPDLADIFIEDIAHALSNQCRYSGHTTRFYSVAQHSVLTSYVVPEEDAFWALMHDASEAYLVDIPSPLKHALFGDQYREVEDRLMTSISVKFGMTEAMPESVKKADLIMLATEKRDLLSKMSPEDDAELWGPWIEAAALDSTIYPKPPVEAKWMFLDRFNELTKYKDREVA